MLFSDPNGNAATSVSVSDGAGPAVELVPSIDGATNKDVPPRGEDPVSDAMSVEPQAKHVPQLEKPMYRNDKKKSGPPTGFDSGNVNRRSSRHGALFVFGSQPIEFSFSLHRTTALVSSLCPKRKTPSS